MEVEQTNFVTHLIITVQLYYRLSKNPSEIGRAHV